MNDERNPFLSAGLLLSAVHAIFWIGISFVGAIFVGLGIGAASIADPAVMLPGTLVGGLVGLAIGIYVLVCVLTLTACWHTHHGSRGWMNVLLAISVIGLLDFGLISTPARLLTIIGICMTYSDKPQRSRAV